ncbi:MAG TPA: Flp pilus assembly protein CpaB [Abditibacteriaceae bacterium]|jgi:Flp pilus assembly protein CpaB
MNRNNLILIGLVALFLVGAGLTAFVFMRPAGQPAATGPNPTPAPVRSFVAKRYIPPRTVITADMLTESSDSPAVAGAISDVDLAVGKLTKEPIEERQVVTTTMITDDLDRAIPATFRIPRRDLRAVGIWVDPLQTAAGLVDKGDRVDIVAVHKLKLTGANASEITSGRTIAQDLEVLGVDRSLNVAVQPTPVPAAPGAAAPAPPAPTPPPQPGQKTFTRVVVAALPEVAERLIAANLSGELHITIRDPQTREAFPIVEAREYPAQSADPLAQKVREAAVQDAIEARRRERQLAYNVRERTVMKRFEKTTVIPNPTLPPARIDNYPVPTPMPNVHEITVVRGTEKTRVVVPR